MRGMGTTLRDLLNRARWRDGDLHALEICLLHRGAPGDRRVVSGARVVEVRAGGIELTPDEGETQFVPYHRFLSIRGSDGELVWDKDAGKVNFEGFHFVYAAGLYDYLSERVAARLTRQMFDMVLPGGRVLVANFAPGLPEVGYMETFMGWKLIYRTPEEMARLSAEVPGGQWKSHRVFWDASENIVFLDLVKRAARTRVAVPGMGHVTFGTGVRGTAPPPAPPAPPASTIATEPEAN